MMATLYKSLPPLKVGGGSKMGTLSKPKHFKLLHVITRHLRQHKAQRGQQASGTSAGQRTHNSSMPTTGRDSCHAPSWDN